jgi:type I restriction enzyme R subunit
MTKSLKKTLKADDVDRDDDDAADDDDEHSYEDEINESMKIRSRQANISYFAFTATPKPKTLELFGTKQTDGSFRPFHLYSMRQAIREKFIKDVLPNYVSYRTCFHMIKKITADPNYDKVKAEILLKTYVELSDTTVKKKTAIIIDHFYRNCMHEMNGLAKAMVVCSSRAQAVKYKIAFDDYIRRTISISKRLWPSRER